MARKPTTRVRDNQIGEKVVTAVGLLGGEATKAEVEKELGRAVTASIFTKLVQQGALSRPRPGVYKTKPATEASSNGHGARAKAPYVIKIEQAMEILFADGLQYDNWSEVFDWILLTRDLMGE